MQMRTGTVAALCAALLPMTALAKPVIPGAVGFGMDTPAGRGGRVMAVTNLRDTGPGSLRECVEASGPRICAFEVSGAIELTSNLEIRDPYITIAGQTAPAPGILLRGASLSVRASNVLVQHIAIRPGDSLDGPLLHSRDAVKILGTKDVVHNVVIDHCSLSWAIDEVVEVWGDQWDNVTLSNNLISEPLRDAPEESGKDQGYGLLIDATDGHISMVGNLIAHVHNRTPRSAAKEFVFVNNVVYNAGIISLALFNKWGIATDNSIVGNVFIDGTNTTSPKPITIDGGSSDSVFTAILSGTKVFLDDNLYGRKASDPWSLVVNHSDIANDLLAAGKAPVWPDGLEPLATGSNAVLDNVLANVGARPGDRSAVDARVVDSVKNRTGSIINCVAPNGTDRCRKNAGGWPKLEENKRVLAIPEEAGTDDDGDGYTNVEEWLQQLAAEVEGKGSSGSSDPVVRENAGSPPKAPVLH